MRETWTMLFSAGVGAALLAGACGGEGFTSDDPDGQAGDAGEPSGEGGRSANGGSKSTSGAGGDPSGEAGEPGEGGTVAAGRGGGGSSGGGGRAGTGGNGISGQAGGGAGGATAGTGGARAGSGGTTGGSGGAVVVGGTNAGGTTSECDLPTGTVLVLDEQFTADVFNGAGWMRTDTSVSVSGGLFKIASDGQYDDYGDIAVIAPPPFVVEARMRNVSGGTPELTPVVEVHFGNDAATSVSIAYNSYVGYGWMFGPPGTMTGSMVQNVEREGEWTTVRAFLRVDGGVLCAKRDDEAGFTVATKSTWPQFPATITRVRLRQSYDDVSEVDSLILRKPP